VDRSSRLRCIGKRARDVLYECDGSTSNFSALQQRPVRWLRLFRSSLSGANPPPDFISGERSPTLRVSTSEAGKVAAQQLIYSEVNFRFGSKADVTLSQ